jgi:hypothetical protein
MAGFWWKKYTFLLWLSKPAAPKTILELVKCRCNLFIYLFVWHDSRSLEFTVKCKKFPKTILCAGSLHLIRPDRHWIVESDIRSRCETLFVDQPHSHREVSPHSPIYALEMHIGTEWFWTGWGAPIHDDQGQIREGENLDQLWDSQSVQGPEMLNSAVIEYSSIVQIGRWDTNHGIGMSKSCLYNSEFAFLLQFTSSRTAAAFRRSLGGAIWANVGSHGSWVDLSQPEIVRIALFNSTSVLLMWTLFNQTGAQYSAVE